jgi:hypothetical protein
MAIENHSGAALRPIGRNTAAIRDLVALRHSASAMEAC